MWVSDKERRFGDYWDRMYREDVNDKWTTPAGGVLDRLNEAMYLLGDVTGKTVLDLGGGPLLGRSLFARGAVRVVLVDISNEALDIAKDLEPRIETYTVDVMDYLADSEDRFDVAIAMGLLDYLPPVQGLNRVMKVWAKELLINAAVQEGYLHQYEARVVIYHRDDILSAARMYGWEMVEEIPQREHLFAKFRKVGTPA